MIHIRHNEYQLPAATAVKVKNSVRAQKYLDRALEVPVAKGLRIRRIPAHKKNMIFFSARNAENIRIAINFLRYAGLLEKVYPGKRCEVS
jgi:hypothetical protein